MKEPPSRRLPPLQLEDYMALLRALAALAWVAALVTIGTEVWVRFSDLEWPQIGGFQKTYRALTAEFVLTTLLLTVLLLRPAWYERVPRKSADRVRWLVVAVVIWLGMHMAWAFRLTGGWGGPLVTLVPVLVLAALLVLPGPAGWWTAAYVIAAPVLALELERLGLLISPGPLTEVFRYTGDGATQLGVAAFSFAFVFAFLLAIWLRNRPEHFGGALGHGTTLDSATGLFDRAFLAHRIEAELARERHYGGGSTLLLMALDGIVDERGDPRSSANRLRSAAQHLLYEVRLQCDTPTRYGLNTLAVLLPTATGDDVLGIAKRMRQALSVHDPALKTRIGAAMVSKPGNTTCAQVLQLAELALGRAEVGGAPVLLEPGA